MNLEDFRKRAKMKLGSAAMWLQQRRRQDLPYVVYTTLAGLTLWPIVEAAAMGGQPEALVAAAYGTAAGIGGNLVANKIEAWKQQADPPTETEVIEWIEVEAPANEEIRAYLDTLIEKVDAIEQARKRLPEADQEWFTTQLQREMTALGNLQRFEVQVGSGAFAQGKGAVALGERAVHVTGKVGGSIITGDINTGGGDFVGRNKKTEKIYHSAPSQGQAVPPVPPLTTAPAGTYEKIVKYFDLGGLQELCHVLQIDYEQLSGADKRGKALSLLNYCERNGQVTALLTTCGQKRTNTKWQ